MSNNTLPSLKSESLYAKSQVYINRGFRAIDAGDREEYQLWASLALELLGKAALALVHPSLVVDPNHSPSLFAACGKAQSNDVKTITAKTLFLRLPHLSKSFDKKHQDFCEQISLRRNAELHSGESPFSGMAAEAWEREFWSAAQCILQMQNESLESWLGSAKAKAPAKLVEKAKEAREWEIKDRITRQKDFFEKTFQDPAKRKIAKEKADALNEWEVSRFFKDEPEGQLLTNCPSCGFNAPIAGAFWEEELVEPDDIDDWYEEKVRVTYVSQEFYCPTCELELRGAEEIAAAGLPEEFTHEESRQREFEPEYGND